MNRLSPYIVQAATMSKCPMCGQALALLCDQKGDLNNKTKPWFYICWLCRNISQVGVGPVTEER